MDHALESLPSNVGALFSVVAWSLWQRRNHIRVGQSSWSSDEILPRSSVIRWIPPSDGIYEINFDGTVFTKLTLAGIGVAIRDSLGHIIAAFSQKILLPHSVDLVEAMVASRVLTFAKCVFLRSKLWVIV